MINERYDGKKDDKKGNETKYEEKKSRTKLNGKTINVQWGMPKTKTKANDECEQ